MCVALAALNASVRVSSSRGERTIPFSEFHRLPGDTPQIETNLHSGELITTIDLPAMPYAHRSHYLKIRDRHSYAFALVSVAAVMDIDEGGVVRQAHIALGGVAHKPWRANKAEKMLVGEKLGPQRLLEAAEAELQAAKPYAGNAFKVELAKRAIVRAINTVAA